MCSGRCQCFLDIFDVYLRVGIPSFTFQSNFCAFRQSCEPSENVNVYYIQFSLPTAKISEENP